ncbi:right-handed parallel beta-helix repeat-containing protein [Curtobacterium sp. PhB136]|uniref:right-handed parallel beta-helix repeat-containing protein n=1 Tax=Curtobacterium sp. PhB136 TaxID=2485181 RepID=UPI0010472532|nr:right-handed parallel beta-helix repeat-containing protein [Curtobacterium sp. PhB136]TCK60187.1 parallel beta helix pectate lyase-like protein [Curtobacterium sp. PhB136]
MAWVGTPAQRSESTLSTLQAALNAAPAGGTVSFDPNDYAFTTALTVQRRVTLASAADSTLFARFTVSAGGLTAASTVRFGVSATPVFSVTGSGVALADLRVSNPNGVLRPTGVQLGAGVTGVTIADFTMDGGGQASAFGVNLTTGSATVTDPTISGVATGVGVTSTSTASGIAVRGGTITAATTGIALGTATAPEVASTTVTGPGALGTGIDLQNASASVVSDVRVSSFARGIGTANTSTAAGPTITDPTISAVSREGISLGSTGRAAITGADVTGTAAAASTGINLYLATGVTITRPTIDSFAYGVFTNVGDTGTGPRIVTPTIRNVTTGVTLGSTQGARITDATITASAPGTGINTQNAGRVTVSDADVTGMLYGVGTTSQIDADSDRTGITIERLTVDGAPNASNAVTLLGVTDTRITDVVAEIAGAGVITHESSDVTVSTVAVTGKPGLTPTSGAAILRAYGSERVNVSHASIDGGSYGVFYSSTVGSDVTDVTVANVSEYGVYARSSADLDIGTSVFRDNGAVGNIVVTVPADGISHDVVIHDSTMTDNRGGVNLSAGTRDVRFTDNVVTGQPAVITAAPAHDVVISGNTVTQTSADATAVVVVPTYEDGADPGSYSSSGIEVRDNRFSGSGTWIRVGSPAGSDSAERRTLQDPVLVVGNTFPADSVAIRTFPNAVVGADSADVAAFGAAARTVAPTDVTGPVAVDARDHGDPNDWGSPCRATGYLDDALSYDGGGATVYELAVAPVLYPENCIDLALTQSAITPTDVPLHAGDTVSWRLTAHDDGPGAAPSGWTVTQLLPDGVTLVSMTGDGYRFDGTTATAEDPLAAGEDAPPVTVTVRVTEHAPADLRVVAYVAPAPVRDLDGDGHDDEVVERTSPLVVPTLETDPAASPTDNDAGGAWTVAGTTPTPSGGNGTGDDGGSDTGSGGAAPSARTIDQGGPVGLVGSATADQFGGLAWTGVSLAVPFAATVVLLVLGMIGLLARRRARSHQR